MDLGKSRAFVITSYWLVCHAMKIGSNATDALIEDIKVEVLRFRMPGFKTYAEMSNEGIRLVNFRNYMFMLLRVTADRSLKLTIRSVPQENLRTFARNFCNIDFFMKILPLKDDELAMSEM